ncbi:hypothetical protein [Lysobacter sp. CA199]|uniref:hypothetical protein n=1 Tax=Lysobacter sp. CA199 TaxID=3455608 RepID=UPI003F8CFAF2
MKNFPAWLVLVLLITGCGPRLAVEQVTVQLHGQRPNAVVAQIEERLIAHGFERVGVSQPNRPGSPLETFRYEAPGDTYASIYIESRNCVSFVTLVDMDVEDRALAKEVFSDAMRHLREDKKLTYTIGLCSNPSKEIIDGEAAPPSDGGASTVRAT